MDHHLPYAAACLLTPEEQSMLLRFGNAASEECFSGMYDLETHEGMSVALADLRTNTHALRALLEQNRVSSRLPLASRKTYTKLLNRIDTATSQVSRMVDGECF